MTFEACLGQLDRPAFEQAAVALAAMAAVSETLAGESIDSIAMRADDMDRC